MRLDRAIDAFLRDKRSAGQINSDRTEDSYRRRLEVLLEDCPRPTGVADLDREDIMRTLRRWAHPNTQANARNIYVSFFDWAIEAGIRKDNPARQTRRPKKRPTSVYRMTRGEVVALMEAARTARERRVIYLGLCAGLRNQELRGLQRRHLERPGCVWVSADIAKAGRERFVPVLPELEPIVAEILANVGPTDYVISAQRAVGGHRPGIFREVPAKMCSQQALGRLVEMLAVRAHIGAHIHPHLLRHAFGDHVARQAGIRAAQAVLGHATIDTIVSTYTGRLSLDELTVLLRAFRWHDGQGDAALERTRRPAHAAWTRSS